MQRKYTPEKLRVVLLSTDATKALYQSRASALFDEYGGGDWPSILLPGAWRSALRFGNFGYGKVIVDANGIVRSIGEYSLENSLGRVFGE